MKSTLDFPARLGQALRGGGSLFVTLLAFTVAFPGLRAQPSLEVAGRGAGLVNAARNADEAWAAVTNLAEAKPTSAPQTLSSAALRAELSRTESLIQASQSAKTFSGRFAADNRSKQAQKLEALYALQAVQFGEQSYKATAFSLGTAYRADKRNSDAERFEIAYAMESITLAEALKGKRFIDDGAKYETMVDTLYGELGDTPEVQGLYVSVLRTTDIDTSKRVATKLLAMKKAPAWARSQAQTTLDRAALIGKTASLELRTIGGSTIALGQPNDRPTVVCFWHAAHAPDDFAAFDHFKALIATDARWIYVGVGSSPPVSDQPMKGSKFADAHCYDAAQVKSGASYLKLPTVPYAYVVNRAGQLVGYGCPESIAALLQSASR